MLIRLIKSLNKGFFEKFIRQGMYKICIKNYKNISQGLLTNLRFKNTFILYE